MRAAFIHFLVCLLCHSCSAAEELPLPQELLERLSRSEIRSIGDLQRLLEIDSVENEVIQETKQMDFHKDFSPTQQDLKTSQTHTRHRRSIVAERASPAGCQVRTVVYEIPRSRVDPAAANFLLWPSCVELQRCSGCCNTGALRCLPSRTALRSLRVAKVEYVRRRPRLREVQVKLEEHLECMCSSKRHAPHLAHADHTPNLAHTDNGVR